MVRNNLKIGDSVAAILVYGNRGRYVLQLRDNKQSIFHPGAWGCFGGAIEPGETAEQALERELMEELEFTLKSYKKFVELSFLIAKKGLRKVTRTYFEVVLNPSHFKKLKLHEGQAIDIIKGSDLLTQLPSIPLDTFAIWSHMNSDRLVDK